jgi:hypothetical protein
MTGRIAQLFFSINFCRRLSYCVAGKAYVIHATDFMGLPEVPLIASAMDAKRAWC